ncbi:MAG: hypothetical protein AAF967_01995 [Pseudomonadota bacterium]
MATTEWPNFSDDYALDPSTGNHPNSVYLEADLSGLPPLHICVGGLDTLRDYSVELAIRDRDIGGNDALSVYSGVGRSHVRLARLVTVARVAISAGAKFLAENHYRRPDLLSQT